MHQLFCVVPLCKTFSPIYFQRCLLLIHKRLMIMNFKRNEGWLTVGHISLMQMEILEKDLKLRSFHRHLIWKISCRTAFNPKTFSPLCSRQSRAANAEGISFLAVTNPKKGNNTLNRVTDREHKGQVHANRDKLGRNGRGALWTSVGGKRKCSLRRLRSLERQFPRVDFFHFSASA